MSVKLSFKPVRTGVRKLVVGFYSDRLKEVKGAATVVVHKRYNWSWDFIENMWALLKRAQYYEMISWMWEGLSLLECINYVTAQMKAAVVFHKTVYICRFSKMIVSGKCSQTNQLIASRWKIKQCLDLVLFFSVAFISWTSYIIELSLSHPVSWFKLLLVLVPILITWLEWKVSGPTVVQHDKVML